MRKIVLFCFLILSMGLSAQIDTAYLKGGTLGALKFRNLGPAFTSGRIADIAIHPHDNSIMYVAVGSGGVWKTTNAGTTWSPIFDKQSTYSIGCISIDPNNPHTVWVGTGENVGGRHVAFGDGVYRSLDGGLTWKNMGLKKSEHISKIIIHPENSQKIWVASQGPLWSSGGERGLYYSNDGGENWTKQLGDDKWIGVTDVVMDPRNPMRLYAATWQRHRTVAAYMGGGPGSGIHSSDDGGKTWTKLTNGIPHSNLGKIGIAISPFDPDRIYAAIELDRLKGGLFMSTDRGASWTKQSDMVSGGTGPHYYQELYADPHHEGRLYLMNNYVLISNDHGKTYHRMNERNKHIDSHAIAWRMDDPDYVIVGTDGGVYESFDMTKTWRFVRNLPVTQYYKLAVDDSEPFYQIYGGTQDNGSHGGPSRTISSGGIYSRDWRKVLGADGHQPAVEPGNPDISYGEFQEGWLFRIDHKTEESVFIQPQPTEGESYERFNWDAPILVSPHNPKRLYFASQRVWRSDDRGDSWTAISEDLTKNEERLNLSIMGRQQSWDNAWDVNAMSNYNTITSLAESPLAEGLIYAGTDDGILQITEDGGSSWRKVTWNQVSGVPHTAFVNDVRADLYDANTVYVALDNHKYGDYKPYFIKSRDRGRTWQKITNGLPDQLLVWRCVQDHEAKNLIFLATEYGVYFTVDGGGYWQKLSGDMPTISIRDITIQRRENDLVAASFGRGFFVLDDYSALREMAQGQWDSKEAHLFPIRKTYWYSQKQGLGGQGHTEWVAPNPPFGAIITYWLKDSPETMTAQRKKREKDLNKEQRNIPFPGWDILDKEAADQPSEISILIKDDLGKLVQTVKGTLKKGLNRVSWNLSQASKDLIPLEQPRSGGQWRPGGPAKATPGTYTATLVKTYHGEAIEITDPVEIDVVPLRQPALRGASYEEIAAFKSEFDDFRVQLSTLRSGIQKVDNQLVAMKKAAKSAERPDANIYQSIYDAEQQLNSIKIQLDGNPSRDEIGEKQLPRPGDGNFIGYVGLSSTYGPTPNHRQALQRAKNQLVQIIDNFEEVQSNIPSLISKLKEMGAPPIED